MTRAEPGSAQDHVTRTYRKRARHYDLTARLYYLVGYPQRTHRRMAVQALQLQPGDTVVEVGCGTGLNFPLIQRAIGPEGRIVGLDLTDAMLAEAKRRTSAHGWQNVTVVQGDAGEFEFPARVDAILSTYALSLVPHSAEVIARGCEAVSPGGRWVVLDTKLPENAPRWVAPVALATLRPFAVTDEWKVRRPWEEIHTAMKANLVDVSWTELFLGLAFLATGSTPRKPVSRSSQEI
jgi:demethylmenaquinone methyltransferase/2-methoxy-6-polyprenyl-1,4-benzoquinol methylase